MHAVKNQTEGGAEGGHSGTRNRQRQRIFNVVRGHDEALDAVELAAKMGLHITTVRFHLDALCSQGVVERTRMARAGVGRPRTGYRGVRERLDYRSLAETLAVELGDTDSKRRRRSEAIGRRWAKRITDDSANTGVLKQQISDEVRRGMALEERAATVAAAFARMGFGSEIVPTTTINHRQRTNHSFACVSDPRSGPRSPGGGVCHARRTAERPISRTDTCRTRAVHRTRVMPCQSDRA